MRQLRGLTAEEAALWRRVKASVSPLGPKNRGGPEKRSGPENRSGSEKQRELEKPPELERGEPCPTGEALAGPKPLKRAPRPRAHSPSTPAPNPHIHGPNLHSSHAFSSKPNRAAISHKARPEPASVADRGPEKRVRRGKVEVAASLDLHGCTQDQAWRTLHAFLRAEQRAQACVVLVVTGKGGRRVAGETASGVLRQRFPEWLQHPEIRALVGGYATAHARHGGGGAFYVFLKRRTD